MTLARFRFALIGSLIILWGVHPRPAEAQIRVGEAIQVNTITSYTPEDPSVSSDVAGNFVVVWTHSTEREVKGRRLDTHGEGIDAQEFLIAEGVGEDVREPDVSMNTTGEFIVVWNQAFEHINARRFANTGVPEEAAYRISHDPPQGFFWGYIKPTVATDGSGGFAAAYHSEASDGGATWVRLFDDNGGAVTDGVKVHEIPFEFDVASDVAVNPAGDPLVMWQQTYWDNGQFLEEVAVRPYSSLGVPQSPGLVLNPLSSSPQSKPIITHLRAGGSIAIWSELEPEPPFAPGFAQATYGQRLDSSGSTVGSVFNVSDFEVTSVAALLNGGFVVVGASEGRVFSAEGIAAGPSFDLLADGAAFDEAQVAAIRGGFVAVGLEAGIRFGAAPLIAQRFSLLAGPPFAFLPGRGLVNNPPVMELLATEILGDPLPVDLDSDGEFEVVVEDIGRTASTISVHSIPGGDADGDVVFVGVDSGGLFYDSVDLDSDGEAEAIVTDPALAAGTLLTAQMPDADSDPDVVFISTAGGGVIIGAADLDGDGEKEIVVSAPDLAPGAVVSAQIPGADTDPDVVFVGTTLGAEGRFVDLDFDGEQEVVFENHQGSINVQWSSIPGSDADPDVVVVSGGATLAGLVDLDGDEESEVVLEDPTSLPGTVQNFVGPGGDADVDVVLVGTLGGCSAVAMADLDGDTEHELILENPNLPAHSLTTHQIPGSGSDVDVVYVAALAGGTVVGSLDVDDDEERELVVLDGGESLGTNFSASIDGDADMDVIFAGSGDAQAVFAVDLGGDEHHEIIMVSPSLTAGTVSTFDLNGLAEEHLLVLGLEGGGFVRGVFDPDDDGVFDLVVESDGLPASTVSSIDLADDNPDPDVIFVATPGGGQAVAVSDLDSDEDPELLVDDPNIPVGGHIMADFFGGGASSDVVFIGTAGVGQLAFTGDLDGDGEFEAILEDSNLAGGTVHSYSLADGDGDADLVYVGIAGGGRAVGLADLDGDDESEVVVENGQSAPTGVISAQVPEGDADADVVFIGVLGGGRIVGATDLDGDGEREVVTEDPGSASGSLHSRSIPGGDADADIVFAGTGGASVITVLSPNEPTIWEVASDQEITWSAPGLGGEVTIAVSRDGGGTFEPLVGSTPNDGSWIWTVTDPTTESAVVRVASSDFPEVRDDSDQGFTIAPETPLFADGFESGDFSAWSAANP